MSDAALYHVIRWSVAIPAEGLSGNGLLAVWPSMVLYGSSARNRIEQERWCMRACSQTPGVVLPRHGCRASSHRS
jgi:hypothetical protein